MTDLSLVSITDLITEIKNRHTAMVIGMLRHDEGNEEIVTTEYTDNKWIETTALAKIISDDINFSHNTSWNELLDRNGMH